MQNLYPQRFAESLHAVEARIDYLQELHINHLHAVSLLKPRPGKNDGGYTIMDYRSIAPSSARLKISACSPRPGASAVSRFARTWS